MPASNLHVVPDELSDSEAAFAEPLAAACRILEQGMLAPKGKQDAEGGGGETDVAVIGDGKLGLLVAAVSLRRWTFSGSWWWAMQTLWILDQSR